MLFNATKLAAGPQLVAHMHVALHLICYRVEDSLVGLLGRVTEPRGGVGGGVGGGVTVSGVAIEGGAAVCECVG